jgi:hypothetical protein
LSSDWRINTSLIKPPAIRIAYLSRGGYITIPVILTFSTTTKC